MNKYKGQSVEERQAMLYERTVEGQRCQSEHSVSLVPGNIVAPVHRVGSQLITDAAVMQHHTLRTTCGTAGVNQVGQIIRRDICSNHIAARIIKQRLNIQGFISRGQAGMLCIGDDITGIGVVENQLNAVSGIVRVARNKGGSSFQDTIH